MSEAKTIYAALLAIQQGIAAPKNQKGYGYEYRTTDGILQAAKDLLRENGVICILSDEARQVGDRYYVTATATLIDIATGDKIAATGTAVEPDKMASMAPPQITGTASTYARKRALEGLFLLDNEKDVDSKEVQDKIRGKQNQPPVNANSGQDSMKQAALKGLNERVKALGVSNAAITNIIHRQFNKASSKEMSTNEVADLANNLQKYLDMGMGA
jgi:hypothetical protein